MSKNKENKMELTSLQEAQLRHSDAVFTVAVAEEQAKPYIENLENARRGALEALLQVNELRKQEAEKAAEKETKGLKAIK